jgi:hypothetical protein
MDTNLHFDASPTVPSELTGQLPRNICPTGGGTQGTILGAILLSITGVYVLWVGIDTAQRIQQRASLRRDGSDATAEIEKLSSSRKTTISYTFTVGGATFAGEAKVPDEQFRSLWSARSLPIRYLPADPTVNHPAAWEWSALSDLYLFFVPIIFVVPGAAILLTMRMDRRLVAEGKPAVAAVTRYSRSKSGFNVKYEFRAEDGTTAKGGGWSQNRPEIGASMWVLYLPQNPGRNQPYPSLNYLVVP